MRTRRKSVHGIVKTTFQYLVADLREGLARPYVDRLKKCESISDVRQCPVPEYTAAGAYSFKCHAQVSGFFKRVIAPEEYADYKNVSIKSKEAFIESQRAFGFITEGEGFIMYPSEIVEAMNLARDEIARILGPFDEETWINHCTFNPNASLGVPLRRGYLHEKVKHLSGTCKQQRWFQDHVAADLHLLQAVASSLKKREGCPVVSAIKITDVPKKHSVTRIIAPDTTLGAYASTGLGEYIAQRLRSETHIDIRCAQDIHKRLAQRASVDGYLCTVDLSKASDAFTMDHLKWLLPPSWLEVVELCRTTNGEILEQTIPLTSAMLMGSGHTFPLQTLCFYALLKGVTRSKGSEVRCYCYGDDLIFPAKHYESVLEFFSKIGFTVNNEKSFGSGPFRESCGGDFYHGVDVRPFQPEILTWDLLPNEYLAFLYKMANGLSYRWEPEEIPNTLRYLFACICEVSGHIFPVSHDAPDFAGYKYRVLPGIQVASPRLNRKRFVLEMPCLQVTHRYFLIPDHKVYLWYALKFPHQHTAESKYAQLPAYHVLSRNDLVFHKGRWVKARCLNKVGQLAVAEKGVVRYRRGWMTIH